MAKSGQELARLRGAVGPDLHQRHHLPSVADRGIAAAQRVRDAAPLLDGCARAIASVDDVPDEGADDAETLHPCCWRKVATAPTTPAFPSRAPGTIRQASTAGLKARRRT